MKKIIGVALFFLVAAAPALAGGNSGGSSNSGGSRMSGGSSRASQSFTGFGAQPAPRSFAPQTREAPARLATEPQRRRPPTMNFVDGRYNQGSMCPKNPYQRPASAVNGCAVNPWVLYAFPDDF
jgi:hypothetical protein